MRPSLRLATAERRFLVAFVLTIVIAGMAPLVFVAGRFAALGEFEDLQADAPVGRERLYGPLDAPELPYKFRMSAYLQPRVLVLGSSNVLQLRRSFLSGCGTQTCFYNAGGGMPTMRAGADFFDELARIARAPDVLLLSLDLWHFNPRYEENTHVDTKLRRDLQDKVRLALGVTRAFAPRVITDPELRSYVLGAIPAPSGLRGARAVLRSEGFRDDGSYSYGTVALATALGQSPSERSVDVVGRIARDCCRFQRFPRADDRSLQELDGLLAAAARAGTKVIAFTVPLSDEAMDSIDSDPAQLAGLREVERGIREVMARHRVAFSPFWRATDAGCKDREMVDGIHPGEVCTARVVLRMATSGESQRILGPYVDPQTLQRMIDRPFSELVLGEP